MSSILLVSVVIIGLLIYNYRRRKLYIFSSKIEGPSCYPLIGVLHHLLALKDTEIIQFLMSKVAIYKSPIKFWFGPKLAVLCTEPEQIQEVLNSPNCLDKDCSYEMMNHLGNGYPNMSSLITSPEKVWRPMRKMLNSCFNSHTLKSFVPIYNEESKRLVQILQINLGKKSFDIARFASACSLDMICRSSLGINLNIQIKQDYTFIDAFESILEIIIERMVRVYLRPSIIFKYFSPYYKDFVKNTKIIKDFDTDLIRKKKEQIRNGTDTTESEKYKIVIHQLLKAEDNGKISYDDVFGEVATILLAGNDTSANTVGYIILLLAIYPHIQEKVYSEINQLFPGDDFELTLDDLQQLPYMDMVLKETLRFFTIVPLISRYVSDDMKIKNLTVPRGVTVLIPICTLHRDKKIWGENADVFNPDNFLPENVNKRHICSYIPFSFGPRICLGMQQGTFGVKVMLVHLLKSYKFTTELKIESLRFKSNITLRLLNKHMVSIVKR